MILRVILKVPVMNTKGITIIDLMMVVVIFGVTAMMIIPGFNSTTVRKWIVSL